VNSISISQQLAHAHALLGWTYVSMFNLDSRTPIGEFTDKALDAGAKRWLSMIRTTGATLFWGLGTRGEGAQNWQRPIF
jgi:hypothetical protein